MPLKIRKIVVGITGKNAPTIPKSIIRQPAQKNAARPNDGPRLKRLASLFGHLMEVAPQGAMDAKDWARIESIDLAAPPSTLAYCVKDVVW